MVVTFLLKHVVEVAAALPEKNKRTVCAAARALAREPLAAPWEAFVVALDFSVPTPFHNGRPLLTIMPVSALNSDEGDAALAMLVVWALRDRVLDAVPRASGQQTTGVRPERGAELLYTRYRELVRGGSGWSHVAGLRDMLPDLAAAARPAAALAAHLLEDKRAQAWWGLRESELRAASAADGAGAPTMPGTPDDFWAAVEHVRETLARLRGVSPRQILIAVLP